MKNQLVWITEGSKSEAETFELFFQCISQYPIITNILKFLDPIDINILYSTLRHCQGTHGLTQAAPWGVHVSRIQLAPSAGMPHRYPLAFMYMYDGNLRHDIQLMDKSQPDNKLSEEHKKFNILRIVTYGYKKGNYQSKFQDSWDIWGELTDNMVFRAGVHKVGRSWTSSLCGAGSVVIYPSWEAIFNETRPGALERFIRSLDTTENYKDALLSRVNNPPLLTMSFTNLTFVKSTATSIPGIE